jgi:methanethiol S-methyltransferase
MIFLDAILIVLLFALFAFSHSALASNKVKTTAAEKLGDRIAFYRLFYNVSSLIFFAAFYVLAPKPDVVVYDLQFPFDIFVFALQVLSLAGLIWAAKAIKLKEFSGIAQILRFMNGQYDIADLDEKQNFQIVGANKIVRHPIYLFSILFLAFRPTMNLFYLVTSICITVYFYIGSFYEEKKLVQKFGDEYLLYMKNVPRIFPFRFRRTITKA